MMSVLDEILKEAKSAGASNVHLTMDCPPVMRIGRSLSVMNFPALTASDTLDILLDVMNETQRELFESRGEAEVAFLGADHGRYRVNAYKQNNSAALSVRILSDRIPELKDLGDEEKLMGICGKSSGLVIVTGAAGSGKTTTIASMVKYINESQQKMILTLEPTIEYQYTAANSLISQRAIGFDAESMSAALKASLHEDTDVIVCGEVSDSETVDAMLMAVETGHLVIAEVGAGNSSGAVDRLCAFFPVNDRALLKARLSKIPLAVIAQNLIFEAGGEKVRAELKIFKNKLM